MCITAIIDQSCLHIFLSSSYDISHIMTYSLAFFIIHGYITNSQSDQLPVGSIVQLVEHCRGHVYDLFRPEYFSGFNFITPHWKFEKIFILENFSHERPWLDFGVTSLFEFSPVNRIEQNSQQPNSRLQINPKEEGTVVELTQFETGNDKLLPVPVPVSVLNSNV